MANYSEQLDFEGNVLPSLVVRDDGVLVCTGLIAGATEPVETSDPNTAAYLAWIAAGNKPAAALPDLVGYASQKQAALANGGYTMTLSGQSVTFETDTASRADIMGVFLRLAQPNPPASVNWLFASGFAVVSAADFVKAAAAIADFVQATFTALQTVLAAIASGTTTSTAEIDAAAWPSATTS